MPISEVDIAVNQLRYEERMAERAARQEFVASPSVCPGHWAHHFIVGAKTMVCRNCSEERPTPVRDWREWGVESLRWFKRRGSTEL